MKRVNGYVIFHNPASDITQEVIQAIQAQSTQTGQLPTTGSNR